MNTPLRFIISLFGDRHVNMLLPLLFSVETSTPGASVSVYWEDINSETILLLRRAFPGVEWIKTSYDFSRDVARRIASKTLVLEQAAAEKAGDRGWLAFLDADMLVVKDVRPFLEGISADAVLTHRLAPFPINSGVVVARAGEKAKRFLSVWREKTFDIVNTPHLYAQANNGRLPYGAADQMALHMLLDYRTERVDYKLMLGDLELTIKMVPCDDLNETYSRPISARTRIIHYKGGWRYILFEGVPFTKNRPMADSWEMYRYYHRNFRSAVDALNARTGNRFTVSDFGLFVPPYVERGTDQANPLAYELFRLRWHGRNFLPRARRYLMNRSPMVKRMLS